jgi:hypothetical protein
MEWRWGRESRHTYSLISVAVAGRPFASVSGSMRPRPCRWHAVVAMCISSGSYICAVACSAHHVTSLLGRRGVASPCAQIQSSPGRFRAGRGGCIEQEREEGGAGGGRAWWMEGGTSVRQADTEGQQHSRWRREGGDDAREADKSLDVSGSTTSRDSTRTTIERTRLCVRLIQRLSG